jgi:hypothetical protein
VHYLSSGKFGIAVTTGAEEKNMKRSMRAALLSMGLWALCSGQVFAQLGYYRPPQINPYPVVSPYLNLMNGGNPATTYFGIIRPQMEMNQNIQGLQQQVQGIQDNSFNQLGFGSSMMQQMPDNALTTGHPAVFQNFSYYYPSMNRGGSGTGIMGNQGGMNQGGMTRPSVFNSNRR